MNFNKNRRLGGVEVRVGLKMRNDNDMFSYENYLLIRSFGLRFNDEVEK